MALNVEKSAGLSEGNQYFLREILIQGDGQSFDLYITFYFQKTTYLSIKKKKSENSNNFNVLIDYRTQFAIRALELFQ